MSETGEEEAWAVLAYTVADDKGEDAALDRSAERELKAFYDAADFSQISIAAQVDFKKAERGVYRAVLTAAPRSATASRTSAPTRPRSGGRSRRRWRSRCCTCSTSGPT